MASVYDDVMQLNTIADFLRFGLTQANSHDLYYGHGTDNAWDDIRSLILGSLALPFDVEPFLLQTQLTTPEKQLLARQLERRIEERIPVPYLTKQTYFCDLHFYVDERVLIPRSPIAELIERQFSPWVDPFKVDRILDLCTGSGCIAIACSYAFPHAIIDAVDLSEEALQVATINCQRHQLDGIVNLIQSDCWQNVPKERYDIIISNPPYVGDAEMLTLPPEYLHEPDMALRTPSNGLAIVNEILSQAHNYLAKDGVLIVEVGNSEEELVKAYPDLSFTWLEFENGGQGVFLLTAQQLKDYFAS
ncbi:adenine specific methylase [Legionella beliardensis]|uniref:Adenine specific methylase n=1 Tax=Legionella beliardensis TaxID=91822 RepID=A0A378I373_9GAMM|nr:50S ribosomal protein L3 N(5)-glutamine methyltransferase [Legionella beliardensis]STX29629.1 adenine specific methylase [Legionella beliardensis]